MRLPIRLLLLAMACCYSQFSMAHDARPVVINLIEQAPDVFFASLRPPPVLQANNFPELVWPESCINQSEQSSGNIRLCPGGLDGLSFAINYPATRHWLLTLP